MSFFAETETATEPGAHFALGYGEVDVTRFVSSREKLATALNCSVRCVAAMLAEPGNPGRTQNGSYELEKWRAYFAARKPAENDDAPDKASVKRELQNAVLRERLAKAEIAELNAAARRGELVELASVKKEVAALAARLRAFHHREMTVEAISVLANRLALDDWQVGVLLEFMEEFHLSFCKKISEWSAVPEVPDSASS